MQFFTSKFLLYVRIILLFTAAFWLVTDPKTLIHSNFVLLLGEAMRLPIIPVDEKSPMNGLLAILLAFNALSDLIPTLADNVQYFETIVPTRLFGFFVLAGYAYTIEDRIISNNVTFVYCFIEIWINFIIYNNLRDEKFQRLKHYIEEHGDELQREDGDAVRVIEEE